MIKDGAVLVLKRNKFGKHFYTLPGGGIEHGESPMEAAARELQEETSVTARIIRQVMSDNSPEFGRTRYFLAAYQDGEPILSENSVEFAKTNQGMNTYQPMWVTIDSLSEIDLLPPAVSEKIQQYGDGDWPEDPIVLDVKEVTG